MSIRKPFGSVSAGTRKPLDSARFFNAAKHNHVGVMREFLNKYDDAAHWQQAGKTALLMAVERGQFMAVQLLLQHGANADDRLAIADARPLHAAAKIDRPDIAGLLLHRLARVDGLRNGDVTPLMDAVYWNGNNVATTLLHFGASVEKVNAAGDAPLHIAAERGHPDSVLLLLEHHADINARNKNGLTPLMVAADNGRLDVARVLLARGANQHLVNEQGMTALDIACAHGDNDLEFTGEFKKLISARNRLDATTMGLPFTEGTDQAVSVRKPLRLHRPKPRHHRR